MTGVLITFMVALWLLSASANPPGFGVDVYDFHGDGPCISQKQRTEIRAQVRENIDRLGLRRSPIVADAGASRADASMLDEPLAFVWPVRAAVSLTDPSFYGISSFPDHDELFPNRLEDWNCGTRTYDLDIGYNHAGTDIFNWPFLWNKMDHNEVEVVAAAEGVIAYWLDGNFDRSCGFGGTANVIVLVHDNGSQSVYGHMKAFTLTSKTVGDTVAAGEYLGVVGSSGSSTGPHLHFEVWDSEENLIDPWEGPCNSTVTQSWWADQRPYYDPTINKISTHSAPVYWAQCPMPDGTYIQDVFVQGDDVYLYVFGRDGLRYDTYDFALRRPDGTVFDSWTYEFQVDNYASAYAIYYLKNIPLAEQTGKWSYEVGFRGRTLQHDFYVGGVPVLFNTVDAVAGSGTVELAWDVFTDEPLRGFKIYRKAAGVSSEITVGDGLLAPDVRRFTDRDVNVGVSYIYVVSAVKLDGNELRSAPVDVSVGSYELELAQNHPNPFNPSTIIEYALPELTDVELKVYDPRGKLVVVLDNGPRAAGHHRAMWDGRDANGNVVSTGVYFCRLKTNGRVLTKKMIFLK
jgi:murein DD-endopeptidase MepM/ murein hydrolase activator NlpD